MIKIYVANLAEYNNGNLKGDWFTLPTEIDEIFNTIFDENELDENGQPNGDWAIHDYEAPFKISEHDSISKLNEIAEELQDVDGLTELLSALNGNDKYNTDNWASLAMNVFSDLDIENEILDDDGINEMIRHGNMEWASLKYFLLDAVVNNEYHLIDGYGNIAELHYSYAENILSDYFQGLL